MIQNRKAPVFIIVVMLLLAIGVILQACSPVQPESKSSFVSTPEQDKYTEAFITYIKHLEQEGLTTAKEIRVEESQPFILSSSHRPKK